VSGIAPTAKRPRAIRLYRAGRLDGPGTRLSPHSLGLWIVSVIALVFLLAPSVFVVIVSLDPARFVSFPPHGLTLDWFGRIGAEFRSAFMLSLELGAVSTAISLVLGTAAALALVRGRFRGRGPAGAFARAPLQVPYLVIGISFLQLYRLLSDHGGPDLNGTLLGLVIAHTVVTVPFAFSAAYTGLQQFPTALEDAAYGLGMGRVRTFFAVTMPTIRPSLFAGAFFAFLISFDNVPVSLYLAGTRQPLPVLMFQAANTAPSPTLYAVSTIVIALSVVAVIALNRFIGLRAVGGAQ
jgi:putative spermidine/putrescine transport system permease protein